MTNMEAVKAFFEENDWDYNEQEGAFESGIALEGDIEGALLQIDANNGGVVVLAGLDYDVPAEANEDALDLCNIVNMLLPTGALFLDITERIIVCRLGQYYGEDKATANDIGEQVSFCLDMIEKVADVIDAVVEGNMTPDEAAEQMLRPATEE